MTSKYSPMTLPEYAGIAAACIAYAFEQCKTSDISVLGADKPTTMKGLAQAYFEFSKLTRYNEASRFIPCPNCLFDEDVKEALSIDIGFFKPGEDPTEVWKFEK